MTSMTRWPGIFLMAWVAFALVSSGGGPVSATPSASSVESSVLTRINAGRSPDLKLHSGLATVARQHSAWMASQGVLSHQGSQQRPYQATPVPAEANGAPDDGFHAPATSCENLAKMPQSMGDPAANTYEGWRESSTHYACMQNGEVNVGGVGAYFDGRYWWVTFIAMTDHTPPGSGTTVRSTPRPTVKPTVKPTIKPTTAPRVITRTTVPKLVNTPKPRVTRTPRPEGYGDDPVATATPDGSAGASVAEPTPSEQSLSIASDDLDAEPAARSAASFWVTAGALAILAGLATWLVYSRVARR